VDVSSYDVSAEYDKDGDLRLTVTPPALLDYKKGKSDVTVEINILEVTYNAYVSANLIDLKRRSRCAIQGIVVEKNSGTKPNVTIEVFVSQYRKKCWKVLRRVMKPSFTLRYRLQSKFQSKHKVILKYKIPHKC